MKLLALVLVLLVPAALAQDRPRIGLIIDGEEIILDESSCVMIRADFPWHFSPPPPGASAVLFGGPPPTPTSGRLIIEPHRVTVDIPAIVCTFKLFSDGFD